MATSISFMKNYPLKIRQLFYFFLGMPPPGMLPPVLFPGLIRPGIQQQLIPTGGPGILPEPTSQGDTGDKDKPQAGSDKKQESSEDTEAVKGRFSVHVHVHVYRIPDSQVYRLTLL